ncbi:glycosyltransferase family 2 protein [Mediterraneibacter faecis]|uniref:glycosyltransferase family 2 protein n=1 Tax=Mediterraneibacter faecis TaxID=592978 RepID=UPI003F9BB8C0
MDNRMLISIIVPIFNVENYLEQCIRSIINQTYKNLEIILVDDGATDNCPQICDRYAGLDKRIKVIHKTNGGLSDARNAGLKIATGEYIGFVDSDDYIEPVMYERLISGCITYDAQVATCGRKNVDENGRFINEMFIIPEVTTFNPKEVINGIITWNKFDVASWDKLYRKDLFKEMHFPVGVYSEDLVIIPSIINKCDKIVHVGESLYCYRQRKGSITKQNFSPKKLTMLQQAEGLYNAVNVWYPDMEKNALYFLWNYYMAFINSAYSSNCKGMKEEIKKGFQIIKNYRWYSHGMNISLRNIITTNIKKIVVSIKLIIGR